MAETLAAMLDEIPGQHVDRIELGALNAWASVGAQVLWQRGKPDAAVPARGASESPPRPVRVPAPGRPRGSGLRASRLLDGRCRLGPVPTAAPAGPHARTPALRPRHHPSRLTFGDWNGAAEAAGASGSRSLPGQPQGVARSSLLGMIRGRMSGWRCRNLVHSNCWR
jgi:hypothetical protein